MNKLKKVLLIFLAFHILDIITTIAFVNRGFKEGNWVAVWFMTTFGTTQGLLIKFATVDALLFALIFWISKKKYANKKYTTRVDVFFARILKKVTPIELALIGQIAVVIWNLTIIFS